MIKKNLITILTLFSISFFSQQSIFWKITKEDSESYIFGTYHYIGKDFLLNNKIILEKLVESNIALSENVDSAKVFINKRNENLMLNKLNTNELQTVKEIVPSCINSNKMTLRELIVTIDGNITGKFCLTDVEKKDKTKMDDYLKEFAIKNQIKLVGLEPTERTFDYLNKSLYVNASEDKLIEILKEKIKFLNSDFQKINCNISNEYRTKKHLFKFNIESQEKLLTSRNKDWINKIDNAIQKNKKAFVFVGLYHLDFKDGLLELLKSKGYAIEEITLN